MAIPFREWQIPKGEAAVFALRQLFAAAKLAESAMRAVIRVVPKLTAYLALGHFPPLQTTFVAIAARLRVNACCFIIAIELTFGGFGVLFAH